MDSSIFRAYDIRGVVDSTLTEAVTYNIARALAVQIVARGGTRVVTGRDGRLSSKRLHAALEQGLTASGIKVIDVGQVPTPVVYFAGRHYADDNCVVITGSHNPPQYNGMKIVVNGETLAEKNIQELRHIITQQRFITGTATSRPQPAYEHYASALCQAVSVNRPLRVVLDCGNGVAGEIAPVLLQRIGCEVIPLHCEIDGTFPNHHPDPSAPANLEDLIATVASHQADVGMAFDGDGDRLGVVDNKGKILFPDRLLILLARDVLNSHPGANVIYDVKCSAHVPREVEKAGGTAIMSRTGHSLIKAAMREHGALLAGEMSGHIFCRDAWFGFDDALYTAARLASIVAAQPRSSAELFATIPDSFNTPEINIAFAEGEHHEAARRIIEHAHFPDARLSLIDGLRADFADSWGLVRASNTSPMLVLRFEGDSSQALERVIRRFSTLIQQACPGTQLPRIMQPPSPL